MLLVADEVICGFGRAGEWFAADYFGFTPDVMTLAKGITSGYIPLGAAMFNDRVAGVLANQGGELAHGCTYSGHPVCAAVALENIRILQDEKIVETCKADTALAPRPALGRANTAWSARRASPAWSVHSNWCRTRTGLERAGVHSSMIAVKWDSCVATRPWPTG